MAVFLLVPTSNNWDQLHAAVMRLFQEPARYEVANRAGIFVSFQGTTIELSNFLGVTGQPAGVHSPVGSVIVTLVTSYYGRGNTDMWEWLKVRMEQV